jgi:hypothetical protein
LTVLILVDDAIELDGVTVARLVPNLRLSQRDRLTELFDAIDEDESYIAELEDRIEQLEERLKAPCPMKRIPASLALLTALSSPAWADSGILPDPCSRQAQAEPLTSPRFAKRRRAHCVIGPESATIKSCASTGFQQERTRNTRSITSFRYASAALIAIATFGLSRADRSSPPGTPSGRMNSRLG